MFSKPLVLGHQSADDATAGCRVMLFISHGSCVVDAVLSGIWHDFFQVLALASSFRNRATTK
jgi:hypothetical protein